MSVKQIIKEAMDRNPINMKEALQEELKSRVSVALEEKVKGSEEDEEQLEEATKTVDDFMKLFKLKKEPENGKRMNLGGYPFDYDGFEEDEIYLVAVDKDAAKGLAKEFKKRGFNAIAKSQEVTIEVGGD